MRENKQAVDEHDCRKDRLVFPGFNISRLVSVLEVLSYRRGPLSAPGSPSARSTVSRTSLILNGFVR